MTPDTTEETDIETTDTTLTLRRTFDAPRERVWRAFTDANELEQWFVPDGMTAEVHTNELEPGGEMAIHWTDGENRIENEGYYVEVIENERLVSGEETEDGELRLTYEFRDVDDGTEVVITQEFPHHVPDGAAEGWASMLDALQEMLAGQPPRIETDETSLTIQRTIDAPRERVWEAWTDPDELARWWGPADWTLSANELDFREGGVWHFCMQGPDGDESWGTVVYEEIVEPERIVATDRFADEDGTQLDDTPELTMTVEFEARDGATELTLTHEGFPTTEMNEGAEVGWTGSLDELEDHLESA